MPVRTKFSSDVSIFRRVVYTLVRTMLFLLFCKLPYRQIRRINKPNLDGPVLWASSHSNFFCDVVVASYEAPRPAKYLAKKTLFRFPLKGFLDFCGALPIVRPEDLSRSNPEQRGTQNRETFKAAIEALRDSWPVTIFPEGMSIVSPGLTLPLKAGVAKLAFAAEEASDFTLGLRIIPVGLEYGSRVRIGSGLTIRYGEPIYIKKYEELYKKNHEEAVRAVLADLTAQMIQSFPHFQNEETLMLGKKLVVTGLMNSKHAAAQLFLQNKNLQFETILKEQFRLFEEKSKEFSVPLAAWGRYQEWKHFAKDKKILTIIWSILGIPFSLWHLAHNIIPEYFLRTLMDFWATDETEETTVRFVTASIFLLPIYMLEFLAWQLWIFPRSEAYGVSGFLVYISFSIFVWYLMAPWGEKLKLLFAQTFFWKRAVTINALESEYKKLQLFLSSGV